jgi:hypothetical protein
MIDDTRAMHLLREHLDREPTRAPASLLASIVTDLDRVTQRKPRFGVRGRLGGIQPVTGSRRLWLAMAVGLLALGLGASALLPGFPWSKPTPRSTATPSPAATASATESGPAPSVVDIDGLATDTELITPSTLEGPYFSGLNPWVTFELYCAGPNCRDPFVGELCPPRVVPGFIELPHAKVCQDSVGVIRPASVACGAADAHPDAASFAAALLANEQLHATDLGSLQSAAIVPTDEFAESYQGRVVQIYGGPTETGADPADCNLLLDASLGLPSIEIRSDTETTLVLVDVGSSLVIVRTVATAGIGGSPNLFLQGHLLNLIHHIRFIP